MQSVHPLHCIRARLSIESCFIRCRCGIYGASAAYRRYRTSTSFSAYVSATPATLCTRRASRTLSRRAPAAGQRARDVALSMAARIPARAAALVQQFHFGMCMQTRALVLRLQDFA